jgi:hypothetical protein
MTLDHTPVLDRAVGFITNALLLVALPLTVALFLAQSL